MHIAEQGDGPLVLLLHGWPETWYSWRHQIDALSAAGYRVVAPDQRGYGATGRPDAVDQYSIFNTAVLRPDVVRGLVCVSIPPIPRGPLPPMTLTEQRFGKGFYQNYFQEPGVAEASLEKDVAATFRLALSGVRNPEPSDGFLGLFVEPEALPDWLTEEALATFVEQFTASGFAGGLTGTATSTATGSRQRPGKTFRSPRRRSASAARTTRCEWSTR
jgi:pimeloyl-ACP methyl ester carboxylesterase